MKFFTNLTTLILLLISIVQVNAQDTPSLTKEKALYDRYGREIRSAGGTQRNYAIDHQFQLKDADDQMPDPTADQQIASDFTETGCQPFWKQGIMGSCIGVNSMISKDIDNDGKTEIICSGGSGFGSGNFWYVLRYDPASQDYEQVWISKWYGDYTQNLSVIAAIDSDNDQVSEIYVGRANGNIEVFNGQTMEMTHVISGISNDAVYKVFYADADNDGQPELVYCTETETCLLNTADYSLKRKISYGARSMALGNVDGESSVELIYSTGHVVRLTSLEEILVWQFEGNGYGNVELTDLDGDSMNEIVMAKSWYSIDIYDADTKTLKYRIDSDLDIDALLLADVNSDGKKEILYGDGQWGDIYCHNATTGQLMWSVSNPEHGTTAINVADADDDGTLELMWGAGCSSTGSDYLFIHEIPGMEAEWQSKHIDGPFYAVKTADADDDGQMEIITLSYDSESGYESGILSVFDAETFNLEWQCDGNFLYGCWTGMYSFEVVDIDNDNETEIVVCAGETYDGQIWVINGSSHVIESEHEFYNGDVDEFYAFSIADVDDDGNLDYIAGSTGGTYIINPVDYSVKWSLSSNSWSHPSNILTGNVDADQATEIIVCNGKITCIDGISQASWVTSQSDFTNIDLYDYNNDGITDIIASTSTGRIGMIDGETREISWIITDFTGRIDGLKVTDLTGNAEPELVFTSAGSVYFSNGGSNLMQTSNFGSEVGAFSGLWISDINQDGTKEILAGTNYQVVGLTDECYRCIDFTIETGQENVSCGGVNDGTALVVADGGSAPYTYAWSTGANTTELQNLSPGVYSVSVTDNKGCRLDKEVVVVQSQIEAEISHTNVGCNGVDNGSAIINILSGTPPYSYLWNTGSTEASLHNLPAGNYSVAVTDSRNCTAALSAVVVQGSLEIGVQWQNVSCTSDNDGSIQIYTISGEPPFSYSWSNGATTRDIFNLYPGNYTVTVTDNLDCSVSNSTEITRPGVITATSETVADNPETLDVYEGSATIIPGGGQPPYYIQWYDAYYQTSPTAINLSAGEYTVRVSDVLGCQSYFTVFVGETNGVPSASPSGPAFSVYPVPAEHFLVLEINSGHNPLNTQVKIMTIQGDVIADFTVNEAKTNIDVSKLMPGFYLLNLSGSSFNSTLHFIVK